MNSKLEPGRLQQDLVPADSGSTAMKENAEKEALVPAEVERLEAELRIRESMRQRCLEEQDPGSWFHRVIADRLRQKIAEERSRLSTGGNAEFCDRQGGPSNV